jgi:nucleolar protein 56
MPQGVFMSLLLITTWFGTFLIDPESGKIIKKKLFPKTVSKLVERLFAIRNQEVLSEEKGLLKGVKDPILITEERLSGLGEILESVLSLSGDITLSPEDFGFKPDLYREALLELGKQRTKESVTKDYYIIQAVKGLDDLNHIANLLSERLHEWYGLHWPELTSIVKEPEYIKLISEHGDRDTILKKTDNKKLLEFKSEDSVGSEFGINDKTAVMGFGSELKNVHTSRGKLESYVNSTMEEIAPNITSLTGPIIGARLIALTGGLARLAKVSSSTIQLLGAEKALFRHLREGGNPPKHGIIFQHPIVHNSPHWQRGKIARAFAGKIAIAAKIDYNSDKFIGDDLNEDLKRRLEEIHKKYPFAPAKKKGKKGRNRMGRSKRSGMSKKTGHGKHGRRKKSKNN